MESFGAMSSAVVPAQSLPDSQPNKRRNTRAGAAQQTDVSSNWDGKVAALIEAQTAEEAFITSNSLTEGRGQEALCYY